MISEQNCVEKLTFYWCRFIIAKVHHCTSLTWFLIGQPTSDDISFKWVWKTTKCRICLLSFPRHTNAWKKQTMQKNTNNTVIMCSNEIWKWITALMLLPGNSVVQLFKYEDAYPCPKGTLFLVIIFVPISNMIGFNMKSSILWLTINIEEVQYDDMRCW
jgi:hypothetical protein